MSGKPTSAYPVVSAKPDILGVAEPSITTAGGDLKGPDKHEPTYRDLGDRLGDRHLLNAVNLVEHFKDLDRALEGLDWKAFVESTRAKREGGSERLPTCQS